MKKFLKSFMIIICLFSFFSNSNTNNCIEHKENFSSKNQIMMSNEMSHHIVMDSKYNNHECCEKEIDKSEHTCFDCNFCDLGFNSNYVFIETNFNILKESSKESFFYFDKKQDEPLFKDIIPPILIS